MEEAQPILGRPETQSMEWNLDGAGIALEPDGAPGVHTFAGCAVRIRFTRRMSLLWHPRGTERFVGTPPHRAPDGHHLHDAQVEIELSHRGMELAGAIGTRRAWKVTVVTEKETICFPHAKLRDHTTGTDGITRAQFGADAAPETLGAG